MVPTKLLPSGARIPVFGLGVYKSKKDTYAAVLSALRLGYRHIDTAQWYRNETDVGRAVQDSGVPRDQVFLTTKLWVSEWGYEKATAAVRQCNERLGGTTLAPTPGAHSEDLEAQGVVRDIGVSNFGEAHLEKLLETARVRPAINQIELHPRMARTALVDFYRRHGVLVEAYSPLAKATSLDDPVVLSVAQQVDATPAHVLLAYSLAKDYVTIPKTVRAARLRENLDALAVQLTPDQVATLDALDEYRVVAWDPIKLHAV